MASSGGEHHTGYTLGTHGTGAAAGRGAAQRAGSAGPVQHGARILVVEDQQDVRRLLVTALELEGHRVDEATDAREGLRRLEQATYDLVLSDYAMPGGTGAWMLHEAASRGLMHGAGAIIVTAHPGVTAVADAQVIPKPLDLDEFLDEVNRTLDASGEPDDRPPRGRVG
ncbi:MAG TPA: response regulator [Vicinamibacterales bacterium]|nr:response regulator [Vicinamibacterales bacterium]